MLVSNIYIYIYLKKTLPHRHFQLWRALVDGGAPLTVRCSGNRSTPTNAPHARGQLEELATFVNSDYSARF